MPSRTAAKQKLDFSEKLIQPGKAAGTDALLRRLKVRRPGRSSRD